MNINFCRLSHNYIICGGDGVVGIFTPENLSKVIESICRGIHFLKEIWTI